MKIFAKNTGLFLLWLAGLVIFSHEIIPHHHHFHSVYTSSHFNHHEDCEQTHEGDEPFDGSDYHCHAFNDITVERQSPVKIEQPPVATFPGFAVAYLLPTDFVEIREAWPYYLDFEASDSDLYILHAAPRRGPPSA